MATIPLHKSLSTITTSLHLVGLIALDKYLGQALEYLLELMERYVCFARIFESDCVFRVVAASKTITDSFIVSSSFAKIGCKSLTRQLLDFTKECLWAADSMCFARIENFDHS